MKKTLNARFASVLAAASFVLALPETAVAQSPAAVFDWSVPDRLGSDGMIGVTYPIESTAATLRVLNPEASVEGAAPLGWPADFNACASLGRISRFMWTVDGVPAGETSSCRVRIAFPRERRYRVALTVVDTSGTTGTTVQDVNIQDWLIIGLGDSYGSGEGVPNQKVTLPQLLTFEATRAAWQQAQANVQEAIDAVNRARAEVDAAKLELAAARRDFDALIAAWNRLTTAQQAVQNAQRALDAADTALATAVSAVATATAKVAFECAQWWDPTGCTAARAALSRAWQTQATAIANRRLAADTLSAANAERVQALAALPLTGFDYARGVLEARINVLTSRVAVATTAFESAKQFLTSANEVLAAALGALRMRAGEIYARWQDSVPTVGAIFTNEQPFYAPNSYSQCHQSMLSGQAQAALRLERDDPKTSVTFIHLACTGATIDKGVLGEYWGVSFNQPAGASARRGQLDMAAALTPGREVDALVTSVGGNDVGFADAMMKCVTTEPCFVPDAPQVMSDAVADQMCETQLQRIPSTEYTSQANNLLMQICRAALRTAGNHAGSDVEQSFLTALAGLSGKYGKVEAKIATLWPDLDQRRMFLTPYPMVSRDQNDNLCGFENDPVNNLPGISSLEYGWAEQVAGAQLNQTIQSQGDRGWTIVEGIDDAFRRHGYCSDATYMVHVADTLVNQVDFQGVAHPNADGHQAYADQIADALRRAFYPEGNGVVAGPSRVDGRQ
jgi:hypothetical protein